MNSISKNASLIGDVQFGKNNFVSPGALIFGPIRIGDNNFFGPNCIIGAPPQDEILTKNEHISSFEGLRLEENALRVGSGNTFREFSTVHQGLTSATVIKDNCYVMSYAHIAHDCLIDSNVKIANSVQMGGYTTILNNSYVGLSATIHQFTVIGPFAMVGMGSVLNKNVIPAGLVVGSPAKLIKVNEKGMDNLGILEKDWIHNYLLEPNSLTIHPRLKLEYEQFEAHSNHRMKERAEISAFRSNLKSQTR